VIIIEDGSFFLGVFYLQNIILLIHI